MTAAHVKDASINLKSADISVTAIATAEQHGGYGDPAAKYYSGAGTIISLFVDGNLSEGAMVTPLSLLQKENYGPARFRDKRRVYGEPASGTSTDAVVVAVTGKGEKLPYAGTATEVGGMIGRTVRKSVTEAVRRYLKYKETNS